MIRSLSLQFCGLIEQGHVPYLAMPLHQPVNMKMALILLSEVRMKVTISK